jgi:ribosomal protein L36
MLSTTWLSAKIEHKPKKIIKRETLAEAFFAIIQKYKTIRPILPKKYKKSHKSAYIIKRRLIML